MDRKVAVIATAFFAAVLVVGVFWGDIMEKANPAPPKLISVTLQRGSSEHGEYEGVYQIKGEILTDCSVAFTYVTPEIGQVEVYEFDGKMYKFLTGKEIGNPTCSEELETGTLTLQFNQKLEGVTVDVWVGKTADDGDHVYFKLIGTWQFMGNSTTPIYLAPSPEKDYKLMKLEKLKNLTKEGGIHEIEEK
ncbi:hypothetical protein A3L09_03690 [Thermococcus profundus]|uniref:Uncharacterized protein n=1 Tax=Thermococcus profundus TaxID=49899 RepID=A0A2Z2M822_THEPR|nr:hypothetical protein [Thermococcus profundus]ASJ02417.1 hypothetical protein A3L09_03690 [Thermococcus profundus]